ncbi:MAG: isopentenyldiphosphate isomerase [Herbinix sp.]|jgi:8-oxo-dGTP pyrophosphatase MutT (NUDIX family)|nr:isopentenyldiphosphate isomerase [Herbinix sp.]
MENWDLYDKNRYPLGRTIASGKEKAEGEYHIVVNIWTINHQGELLLTLRHPDKKLYPNMWECTGGSVLSGETSQEGAVRELWEETGIQIREAELIYMGTYKDKSAFIDSYTVYKDVDIQDIKLQEGETISVEWIALEELDDIIESGRMAIPVVNYIKPMRDVLNKMVLNIRTKDISQ